MIFTCVLSPKLVVTPGLYYLHPMNQTHNRSQTESDAGHAAVGLAHHCHDFTKLEGPDGETFLVPRFMVPVAELHMDVVKKTSEMPLDKAKNGVSPLITTCHSSDI